MKSQKEVVKKVIDYIEKNLEEEINLDNISKILVILNSILIVFLQRIQESPCINICTAAGLLSPPKNW